jgi:hypothetical protein
MPIQENTAAGKAEYSPKSVIPQKGVDFGLEQSEGINLTRVPMWSKDDAERLHLMPLLILDDQGHVVGIEVQREGSPYYSVKHAVTLNGRPITLQMARQINNGELKVEPSDKIGFGIVDLHQRKADGTFLYSSVSFSLKNDAPRSLDTFNPYLLRRDSHDYEQKIQKGVAKIAGKNEPLALLDFLFVVVRIPAQQIRIERVERARRIVFQRKAH